MVIHLPASGARNAPSHVVFVAPAAELGAAAASEWIGDDGKPLTIPVDFKFGRAEVPDNLGVFMVSRGYAARTSLILPDHVAA